MWWWISWYFSIRDRGDLKENNNDNDNYNDDYNNNYYYYYYYYSTNVIPYLFDYKPSDFYTN